MPTHPRGAQGRRQRSLTIEDLGRMILADYAANGRKTANRVDESYRLHLIPFFQGVPAGNMGLLSSDYAVSRLAEGSAPATVRQELMNLSRGLTLAVHAGLLDYRPAIRTPRVQNARQYCIPEKKVNALLAYLPAEVRDVAEMAYLTGWRRSEILGLEWRNVDLEEKMIRLDAGTTKNGEGRLFPFGAYPRLASLVAKRRRKTLEVEAVLGVKIAPVFHRDGIPIRRFRRSWLSACRRAELEGFVFHDLRRSAAQMMHRAGVPVRTAMQLMGHKTRSMHDRYLMVDMEDLQSGIERLAARMASSQSRLGL